MSRTRSKVIEKRIEQAQNIITSQLGDPVERASMQERFRTSKNTIFNGIYNLVKNIELEEPAYSNSSRERDAWLLGVVKREPFLQGVLSTIASIDKNRGWKLIGHEKFVREYTKVLHNIRVAPDISGWRPAMSIASQAYNNTDIGAIMELEWKGNSRLNKLYTTDSTRFMLTGSNTDPLWYYPRMGARYTWTQENYFRIVDQPSMLEGLNGLGVCAASRCIEMVKIMVGLFDHDKERLLSKTPKGILLLKGISENQWLKSLEDNAAQMTEKERMYYTGVQTLASDGNEIDAKLVSFSMVPEGLSQAEFVNVAMYLYALATGYDSREFWPVSSGSLGTGNETNIQHQKANQKGGVNFALSMQEQLQEVLPSVIDFEFEERDANSAMVDQQLQQSIIANVTTLLTTKGADGETIINTRQARELLAKEDILPKEWVDSILSVGVDTDDNPSAGMKLFPDAISMSELQGSRRITIQDLSGRVYDITPDELNKSYDATHYLEPVYDVTPDSIRQHRINWDKLMSKPGVSRSIELLPTGEIVEYSSSANIYRSIKRPAPIYYSIARSVDVISNDAQIVSRDPAKQVSADETSIFLSRLTDDGIGYSILFIPCRDLVPSQQEVNREKVDKIKLAMESGDPLPAIYISEDNTIADGHHRMIAQQETYGDMSRIACIKIELPVDDIHDLMEDMKQ